MIARGLDGLDPAPRDVTIVGAGPAGITLALECARFGRSVLLLESGFETANAATQALSDATITDPSRHDAMGIAVARRFGGTSTLWGWRCQPLDPIDFTPRPGIDARWPIGLADLAPHYETACRYAACGEPVFAHPLGAATLDDGFDATRHERFSTAPDFGKAWRAALAGTPRIEVRLGVSVTGFDLDASGRVATLRLATLDGTKAAQPVAVVAIASGGLETTRLLLALQARHRNLFGGPDGPLGRTYMGHLIGEVADITLADAALDRAFDFRRDGHGSYARRRLIPSDDTQAREALLNVSFWPVVPAIADPAHRSGALSAMALAMASGPIARAFIAEAIRKRHAPPGMARGAHVANLIRDPKGALIDIPAFVVKRQFGRPRLPGFFIRNPARRYRLSFHQEHAPNPESRVWLTEETDALGLPRLGIDLRFTTADAEACARAHRALKLWFERNRLGTIDLGAEATLAERILALAAHGTHQIGTARMGFDRRTAVVDKTLACFDVPNLFVASAAAMPTSGQANPTLTVVALAARLAAHLASR